METDYLDNALESDWIKNWEPEEELPVFYNEYLWSLLTPPF